MQEEVGAKPKTTSEEKRQKAENVAPVDFGKGRGGKKSGSRFLSLKSKVVERLQSIHEMMEQTKGLSNSKDIISHQASIREELRQAQDDWNELNSLYQAEAKKKRSKFTSEELEIQQTLVQRLAQELEKIKQVQMRGYIGGNGRGEAPDINADILNSINVKTLDPTQNRKWGDDGGGQGVEMTEGQRMKVQQLQDRDREFDTQLDEIGEGIQDLAEIAQMQGEEVNRQNVMLDNLNDKIENVQDHMTNVNSKMKETLEEVGRSSDKLCIDIMCIMIMVGFGAVLYNFVRGRGV